MNSLKPQVTDSSPNFLLNFEAHTGTTSIPLVFVTPEICRYSLQSEFPKEGRGGVCVSGAAASKFLPYFSSVASFSGGSVVATFWRRRSPFRGKLFTPLSAFYDFPDWTIFCLNSVSPKSVVGSWCCGRTGLGGQGGKWMSWGFCWVEGRLRT